MNTGIKIVLSFLIAGFALGTYAQKERKFIRAGNEEYFKAINDTGAVDTLIMQKAELNYRKALNENIHSYEAGYNLAASLYKQQKFDQAETQYQLLLGKKESKTDQAELYYNIGNALLGQGKIKESIEAYKNSLRANPNDTAAKYNLAVAQKMLNEMQQQQEQQQNGNDQNQDQQEQDQDQQQQQQQQGQEQQSQNQQQQAAQQGDENKDQEQQQMQQAQKDEISKEDAERILMSLSREEQKLLQKLQQEKSKAKRKKLDKDW